MNIVMHKHDTEESSGFCSDKYLEHIQLVLCCFSDMLGYLIPVRVSFGIIILCAGLTIANSFL